MTINILVRQVSLPIGRLTRRTHKKNRKQYQINFPIKAISHSKQFLIQQ